MRAASLENLPEAGRTVETPTPGSVAAVDVEAPPDSTLESSSRRADRLEETLEVLPVAAIAVHRRERALRLNAEARALLGLPAGAVLHSVDELGARAPMFGADGSSVAPLARALQGESIRGLAVRVTPGSGERRWIIDANPIRDLDTIVGAICTVRDVTELTLDDEMGDELLGRAAHDLRTPLTAMKASAQLIGRGYDRLDVHARQRTLGLLLAQIDKLSTRIDEVVDASRIRRNRLDVHLEDLDLAALLAEVIAELNKVAGMPPCELVAHEPLWVHADRARIRQVVRRLASDAATRETARIVFEAGRASEKVTVSMQVAGGLDHARGRTGRRLALRVLERLGGTLHEDREQRLVLTLPAIPG